MEPVQHHPLKRWRFEHAMNLAQAAQLLGTTAARLSRIENGETPSSKLAMRIAGLTEIPVSRLFSSPKAPHSGGDA